MHSLALLTAALAAVGAAAPLEQVESFTPANSNPFVGKVQFVNPVYAKKLEETIASFKAKGDKLNAAKVKTVQKTSTFVWVSNLASLPNIAAAVKEARYLKKKTGKDQIVGLIHYNLPDRDCSAGESAGEFDSTKDGLNRYKKEFVDVFAAEVAKARDITFAVVLEPDSLGNVVTNQGVEFCKRATPVYKAGIAYAIQQLQLPNVHLYIDAAHGGWLGWDPNLPLAADVFSEVVQLAAPKNKIRGFVTNVSNFNPYIANPRANYTQYSNSYDEFNYAKSLTPFLKNASLPANFIIDQGRAGLQNTRTEWGEWCNVKAGYGIRPTSETNRTADVSVDAIVWAKPGGESDGACGQAGAPGAGLWFNAYVEELVKNANPPLAPSW